MAQPLDYNPFAYEIHEDPYPTYARLRDEAPAYRNAEMGFWALSRFDDVLEGYRDWETYTSSRGITLGDAMGAIAPSMIGMDPPRQTRLRKLVVRAFTPERVAAMEPRVRALTTRFLDRLVETGECDLIARFAALLPSDVISTLLGVPPEDHADLRIWTATFLTREDGVADLERPLDEPRRPQPAVHAPRDLVRLAVAVREAASVRRDRDHRTITRLHLHERGDRNFQIDRSAQRNVSLPAGR